MCFFKLIEVHLLVSELYVSLPFSQFHLQRKSKRYDHNINYFVKLRMLISFV